MNAARRVADPRPLEPAPDELAKVLGLILNIKANRSGLAFNAGWKDFLGVCLGKPIPRSLRVLVLSLLADAAHQEARHFVLLGPVTAKLCGMAM